MSEELPEGSRTSPIAGPNAVEPSPTPASPIATAATGNRALGAPASAPARAAVVPAPRPAASLKKDGDSSIPSYPALVYREFIAALVVGVFLMVIALVLQSPLEQQADPSMTPNPSKAPWYFLGLQELLSRVPPISAGVAFPTFVIVGLIAMPYLDRNPHRHPARRKVAMLLFSTFVVFSVAFAVIGVFFRGLEWRWFWTGILGR